MQFTSLVFLVFFGGVVSAAVILPKAARNLWLLAASFMFYLYRRVWYGVFLLFSVLVSYGCGRLLAGAKSKRTKKWLLAGGIVAVLGPLLLFKYYNFAVENVGTVMALLGRGNPLPVLGMLAPVGISFYTFQTLGYLMDVYRGQTPAEKNLLTFALFVSFFPQVQAGPIGRSTRLLPQFKGEAPDFSWQAIKKGAVLIGWGFFKKLVIADRLSVFVSAVFDGSLNARGVVLVCGVLLFAVQMYADFSSYSTIAIGAAAVLGYQLDANFDLPYFSATIPEFWRRWHITLGSWFKDYLFYPLLRNRALSRLGKKSAALLPKYYAQNLPVVLALVVVWFSTGLWHGASWTYVVWGLYHGLLIILGLLLAPQLKKLTTALKLPVKGRAFRLFQVVRTFLLVCVGYVFFRSASVAAAVDYFARMAAPGTLGQLADGTLLGFGLDAADFTVALAGIVVLFCVELASRKTDVLNWLMKQRLPLRWAVLLLGLLAIVVFGQYGDGYVDKPFIYFQF